MLLRSRLQYGLPKFPSTESDALPQRVTPSICSDIATSSRNNSEMAYLTTFQLARWMSNVWLVAYADCNTDYVHTNIATTYRACVEQLVAPYIRTVVSSNHDIVCDKKTSNNPQLDQRCRHSVGSAASCMSADSDASY